ncbi:MAG: PAS domain S-box protein [Ignavibacteriales bacterium]|nr:PAS domain S-box protein [Ignavibacteriales bacterium]
MEAPYSQDRMPRRLFIVFLLFVASIGTAGYFYYQFQVEHLKYDKQQGLAAIAQLKVNQIVQWRKERLGDAQVIFENPALAASVKKFFSSPNEGALKKALRRWMKSYITSTGEYECVYLADAGGNVALWVKSDTSLFEPYDKSRLIDALKKKQIVSSDLHEAASSKRIHMDIYVPLLNPEQPQSAAIGLLMLELDSEATLFPLIRSWPTPSQTSESLLFRREGDEIVFLNELRHRNNSALLFKLPMSSENLPAAMALRGREGVVEGIDYRGVPVLAALNKIPDSPWFLVAKIDKVEVYAPIREQIVIVTAIEIILIVSAGSIIGFLWRHQRALFYKKLYKGELERGALLENINYLQKHANDTIILTDEQGNIIEVNDKAVRTYGYTAEEFRILNIRDIRALDAPSDQVTRQREIEEKKGFVYESIHRRNNGLSFPVEISAQVVTIEGTKFFQYINRDITERKRAEQKIKRLTRVYAVLSDINQAIVRVQDRQKLYDDACRIIVEDGLFKMAWIGHVGEKSKKVNVAARFGSGIDYLEDVRVTVDDSATGRGPTGMALRQGHYVVCNDIEHDERMRPWRDKALRRGFRSCAALPLIVSGRIYGVLTIYAPEPNAFDEDEIKLLHELSSDISFAIEFIEREELRKKAEETLKASEEQYRLLFKANPHPMWVYDLESLRFLTVNETAINHYGYSEEEFLSMTVKDIRPLDDVPKFLEKISTVPVGIDEGGFWRHRKKDGTVILVKITSHVVMFGGKQGKIVLAQDVTEQKKAEEVQRKLANQRDELLGRLKLQFDRMPLGYILINPELAILEWNPAAEKLFGYSREEMVGKSPYGLILSTTANPFLEKLLEDLKKGNQTLVAVNENITKEGKTIICEWHNTPLKDESGQFIGFISMVQDITERKEAEKSLNAAEHKFRGLVEQSLVGIYIIQGNNFVYVNPKMAEIFGYTPEEIIFEKTISDLVMEEGLPIVQENIRKRLENEMSSVRYGFRGKRKNGAPVFIEVFGARTEYNGQPAIIGTLLDVTNRRVAEESANRLLHAVEQTDEVIFMTEVDGTIRYVNPAFEKLYGFTKEEVIGKTPRILKSGQIPDEHYRAFWQDLLAGKSLRMEYINKSKLGALITIEASVNPVYSADGIMTGFIAVQKDITQRKTIENEKKSLEDQIIQMQKMESLGTLAGGIAHDFNNILGIIIGRLSLVENLVKGNPKLEESWEAISKTVQRGAGLVRQILTFARKTDTPFDTVDVNTSIQEITELLQQTFPKTIIFSLHLDPHLPSMLGDHTQLHQTLLNLCVNARDAMADSGTLTLSTRLVAGGDIRGKFPNARAEQYVMVTVSDTGMGMEPETLSRIFEPFFTKKERGKGTGLGLAVVYGVMASHNGFVDVTSEVGKGSAFYLYFPSFVSAEEPRNKQLTQANVIQGGTETILLVEDEGMLRESTVMLLERKGYRVLTAIDGKEAIEVYRRHWKQISLVFSDEGLPKLGGWEVFIEMKRVNPKVKTILTSGYLEPNLKAKFVESGVRAFIQKPYTQIEVLSKIREVIDG